ncbi:Cytochrome c-type biogenesis protein CcmH [bacterium HR23]|nr:Cytochrome c-type biogenesis protein CcmH [bacterium HR23]
MASKTLPLPVGLAVALALALAGGWGCRPTPTSLEAQAQALDRKLMCPVCPGETIDQSRALQAKEMRQVVREMLAQGKTEQEILQYFVDRYGPGVLAAPPARGGHWVVWLVPPIGVVVAVLLLWRATRGLVAPRAPSPAPSEDLGPYLAEVDRAFQERMSHRSRPPSDA